MHDMPPRIVDVGGWSPERLLVERSLSDVLRFAAAHAVVGELATEASPQCATNDETVRPGRSAQKEAS